MTPYVGVLRRTFTVGAETDEVTTEGTLWLEIDEDELIAGDAGDVVLYTLDRARLVGMFAAVRDGATDEDLFLTLDAAALGVSEDGDG